MAAPPPTSSSSNTDVAWKFFTTAADAKLTNAMDEMVAAMRVGPASACPDIVAVPECEAAAQPSDEAYRARVASALSKVSDVEAELRAILEELRSLRKRQSFDISAVSTLRMRDVACVAWNNLHNALHKSEWQSNGSSGDGSTTATAGALVAATTASSSPSCRLARALLSVRCTLRMVIAELFLTSSHFFSPFATSRERNLSSDPRKTLQCASMCLRVVKDIGCLIRCDCRAATMGDDAAGHDAPFRTLTSLGEGQPFLSHGVHRARGDEDATPPSPGAANSMAAALLVGMAYKEWVGRTQSLLELVGCRCIGAPSGFLTTRVVDGKRPRSSSNDADDGGASTATFDADDVLVAQFEAVCVDWAVSKLNVAVALEAHPMWNTAVARNQLVVADEEIALPRAAVQALHVCLNASDAFADVVHVCTVVSQTCSDWMTVGGLVPLAPPTPSGGGAPVPPDATHTRLDALRAMLHAVLFDAIPSPKMHGERRPGGTRWGTDRCGNVLHEGGALAHLASTCAVQLAQCHAMSSDWSACLAVLEAPHVAALLHPTTPLPDANEAMTSLAVLASVLHFKSVIETVDNVAQQQASLDCLLRHRTLHRVCTGGALQHLVGRWHALAAMRSDAEGAAVATAAMQSLERALRPTDDRGGATTAGDGRATPTDFTIRDCLIVWHIGLIAPMEGTRDAGGYEGTTPPEAVVSVTPPACGDRKVLLELLAQQNKAAASLVDRGDFSNDVCVACRKYLLTLWSVACNVLSHPAASTTAVVPAAVNCGSNAVARLVDVHALLGGSILFLRFADSDEAPKLWRTVGRCCLSIYRHLIDAPPDADHASAAQEVGSPALWLSRATDAARASYRPSGPSAVATHLLTADICVAAGDWSGAQLAMQQLQNAEPLEDVVDALHAIAHNVAAAVAPDADGRTRALEDCLAHYVRLLSRLPTTAQPHAHSGAHAATMLKAYASVVVAGVPPIAPSAVDVAPKLIGSLQQLMQCTHDGAHLTDSDRVFWSTIALETARRLLEESALQPDPQGAGTAVHFSEELVAMADAILCRRPAAIGAASFSILALHVATLRLSLSLQRAASHPHNPFLQVSASTFALLVQSAKEKISVVARQRTSGGGVEGDGDGGASDKADLDKMLSMVLLCEAHVAVWQFIGAPPAAASGSAEGVVFGSEAPMPHLAVATLDGVQAMLLHLATHGSMHMCDFDALDMSPVFAAGDDGRPSEARSVPETRGSALSSATVVCGQAVFQRRQMKLAIRMSAVVHALRGGPPQGAQSKSTVLTAAARAVMAGLARHDQLVVVLMLAMACGDCSVADSTETVGGHRIFTFFGARLRVGTASVWATTEVAVAEASRLTRLLADGFPWSAKGALGTAPPSSCSSSSPTSALCAFMSVERPTFSLDQDDDASMAFAAATRALEVIAVECWNHSCYYWYQMPSKNDGGGRAVDASTTPLQDAAEDVGVCQDSNPCLSAPQHLHQVWLAAARAFMALLPDDNAARLTIHRQEAVLAGPAPWSTQLAAYATH